MNRLDYCIMSLLLLAYSVCGNAAETFRRTERGITFTSCGADVEICFYSPSIVRVCKTPVNSPDGQGKKSLVVTMQPEPVSIDISGRADGKVVLSSSLLSVTVNTETGGICFADASEAVMLVNKDYGASFAAITDGGKPSYQVRESFLLDMDEPIYGVGQVMDGKFSRRNSIHHMQNENMFTYSPYFLSPTKGYAVYWDNYSISDFVDTPQDLSFQGIGRCSDYYFIYGKSADNVISGVRRLTGKTPLLPLWAYGFFQSKERYRTQDESLGTLRKLRELRIPVDCMIQDWRYWPEENHSDSTWNSHSFDPERFPDPAKWGEELHKLNSKLLIVTWPGFGCHTEQYKELDSKNMLINFKTFPSNSGAKPYDAYNPEARKIYWRYLNNGVYSVAHNDGWWLDSTEPDHIDRQNKDYEQPTYAGTYRSVKNAYSLMQNIGIGENQRLASPDKRVVLLTRSGFIGQQHVGSITWSGDVESTWEMLAAQIPAALNFTVMGLPYWNSDIGGFWARGWGEKGGCGNPEFQELYVRWMQFSLFCPMMRSHGTGLPREIFNFGKRGDWCFDAQEKAIRMRYSLLPYIYSTGYDVWANDGTFMRPLFMDFPTDKNVYEIGCQYMFGKELLVAPVTEYGAKSWKVYLPAGARWINYWTGKTEEGGQTVDCAVDRATMPLYVKAGSIMPVGPDVQYSTEKSWENLLIDVYPGADGTFTLYEDENDNFNYEKGNYSLIKFSWNDASRSLEILPRDGHFKGMLKNRVFTLRAKDSNKTVTVKYNGKKIGVKLN